MNGSSFLTDRAGGYILSLAEIEAYRGPGQQAGPHLRFYCPIHGGDHQRSFRLDPETGHFRCFNCGAWGYTVEARQRWSSEFRRDTSTAKHSKTQQVSAVLPLVTVKPRAGSDPVPRPDLLNYWSEYVSMLDGSPAVEYLETRGIPVEVARQYGVGYAPPGRWLGRDVPLGRVVFPHTIPSGELVSLYGRAIEIPRRSVDAGLRHDHLVGSRGWWNAGVVTEAAEALGPLFVCEGVFDALAWIAAGFPRSLAIFGVHGWRWQWLRACRSIVLSLDMDTTGVSRAMELAREAVLFGKDVRIIEPADLGGAKDVSEAWQRKTLTQDTIRQAISELHIR